MSAPTRARTHTHSYTHTVKTNRDTCTLAISSAIHCVPQSEVITVILERAHFTLLSSSQLTVPQQFLGVLNVCVYVYACTCKWVGIKFCVFIFSYVPVIVRNLWVCESICESVIWNGEKKFFSLVKFLWRHLFGHFQVNLPSTGLTQSDRHEISSLKGHRSLLRQLQHHETFNKLCSCVLYQCDEWLPCEIAFREKDGKAPLNSSHWSVITVRYLQRQTQSKWKKGITLLHNEYILSSHSQALRLKSKYMRLGWIEA